MAEPQPKSPRESLIETQYIVMPNQANPQGTAFGGVILSWVDMAAAMVASKHCRQEVVTVSIDQVVFTAPIYVGDHVRLRACLNYVGTTSMEIGVQVMRENPATGEVVKAATAYMTFVALGQNKQPAPAPRLRLETDADRRRCEQAKVRVQARREMREKIRRSSPA